MSRNNVEQIIQTPISDAMMVNNLNSRIDNEEYTNPVLTLSEGKEYRYRLVKEVIRQRLELSDSETYIIEHDVPYQFIVATLKYLVHSIDAQRDEKERGWHPQTLLLAESKESGYAIAVLVTMRDFLVTVVSVERVLLSEYESKKLSSYAMERKFFLNDLDLDVYLETTKEKKKEKRQRIAKRYPSFWEDESIGRMYRFACTKHLKEQRSNSSGVRLTIPMDAVKDVLKYAMDHSASALREYIGTSEKEKQLVLVFPSLDKSYNVGILIAIDDLLVTVISMYDVTPKDKGLSTLIFPNAKRIILADYDLAVFMKAYNTQKAEKISLKKQMIEQQLEIACKQGGGIKKFSSLDEYDEMYMPKRVQKIVSTGKMSKGLKKITIVEKIKPVQCEDDQQLRIKEKHRQSVLLGLSAQMLKTKVDKGVKAKARNKKKKNRSRK